MIETINKLVGAQRKLVRESSLVPTSEEIAKRLDSGEPIICKRPAQTP